MMWASPNDVVRYAHNDVMFAAMLLLTCGLRPYTSLGEGKYHSKKPSAYAIGFFVAGAEGLEPTTHGFGDQYSTN